MTTLETATLWLHIAAGALAVLAGLGALATAKGSPRHKRVGRVYVAAMGLVVVTVVPLFVIDPTFFRTFLLLVAVFSGYFAFSGYRAVGRKRPAAAPARVDWVAAGVTAAACLVLGGWGVSLVASGDTFGVVMVVFGAIGAALGSIDLVAFRRGAERPWLPNHLSRMVGAYIATVTAVSVVNLTTVPAVVAWLWPTAVGVPLIWYWQATYANTGPLAGRVGG